MKTADKWKDYQILATGSGEKLERWGKVVLLRPDPQVIWKAEKPLAETEGIAAHYIRSSGGGGHWEYSRKIPDEWVVHYPVIPSQNLSFKVKPMGFKHTGLFPEQAANWEQMIELIQKRGGQTKILNLFAYTGGASVACAYAGAAVTHIDASKGMNDRAKENLVLSGLGDKPVRFIMDDCLKFVEREIRRGSRYDGILMDPPSYGRGPSGEMWRLEDHLFEFAKRCSELLSDKPLFFLINSYTTGLQPLVLSNLLNLIFKDKPKTVEAYEIGLPTAEGLILPCGASGLAKFC